MNFFSSNSLLELKLSTLVGLKNLVDQTCWDMLFNAQRYRSEFLEVEVFLRFLQEFYDQYDLLFLLYVRAVVARTLHISFKRRWAKTEGIGNKVPSFLTFILLIFLFFFLSFWHTLLLLPTYLPTL